MIDVGNWPYEQPSLVNKLILYICAEKLLFGFVNEECFFRTSRGQLASDVAILELHKASQMATHDEKDHILDKIILGQELLWSKNS